MRFRREWLEGLEPCVGLEGDFLVVRVDHARPRPLRHGVGEVEVLLGATILVFDDDGLGGRRAEGGSERRRRGHGAMEKSKCDEGWMYDAK